MAMEVCEGEGADIISSLPEGILSHIISFLPLREAIKTCLLSRKWRNIFTLISNIDADIDDMAILFMKYDVLSSRARRPPRPRWVINRSSFMNLVDGFLSCRTGFVDKVRIRCQLGVDPRRVNEWIRYALGSKVKVLDLSFSFNHIPFELPIEIFTCNTLEVLRLVVSSSVVVKELPAKICLPNLKRLHLDTLETFDNDSIQRLIRSCSLLEELELALVLDTSSLTQGCISNIMLIRPTLKRLKVLTRIQQWHQDRLLSFHSGMVDRTICLPSLKFLHLCDIQIFDGDSFQTLISSCLALEELVMENCHLKSSRELNVFNSTLKRLTISCVNRRYRGGVDRGFDEYNEIAIDAPSLVYFNYQCCRPFLLENLNSRIKVHIDFAPCFHCISNSAAAICLFKGIGNTQSLHLSFNHAKALLEGNRIIPEFPKLTYLKLEFLVGWERVLPQLLSHFPRLEALDFKVNLEYSVNINTFPQHFSLWSPLKKLDILSFEGKDSDMEIVDYFLKNAQALENLTVKIARRSRHNKGEEWISKITETMLNLPKISTKCKILVV